MLLLQVGKYTFRADYDSSNLANVQQGANSAVRQSLGLGMRSETSSNSYSSSNDSCRAVKCWLDKGSGVVNADPLLACAGVLVVDSQGLRGHPCGKAHKDVVLLWGVWRSAGEAVTITLARALHWQLPVTSTRDRTRCFPEVAVFNDLRALASLQGDFIVMTLMNLNKQSRLYSQDYRPWVWRQGRNEWSMIP